ncbi:MAG: hypothetical protein P1U58_05250 [Verrucomicrobiales bacterium]|nr:hypothetical protein [Verrucomicrobiales bacterium]
MKCFVFALFPALFLASCITPDSAELENTIEVQDEKMWERAEKSRVRKETWDRKWESYSDRQDAKYDAWIDSAFD